MITRDILKSHPLSTLKKEISKYNKLVTVSGYSKMKKGEVIELMMKHPNKFKHIKMKGKTEPKKDAKKKQTQKEIKEFEESLAKELEDPAKFNELFGDLPKKKKVVKKAGKVPKITITEAPKEKKKIVKKVKSQLPPLKEKPVKLRLPKAEKPAPKVASEAAKLKLLKKELKSKGVSKIVLKFIKTVKAAEEKLLELASEEPEDKSVKIAESVKQQIPLKNQAKIKNLILKVLPRNEFTLQDQIDYFKNLKEMGENWNMSSIPRQRYNSFDDDEKMLFELLYPSIFDKKDKKKKADAKRSERKAKGQ